MDIEAESPEELGYDRIKFNLAESSVSDIPLNDELLNVKDILMAYGDHMGLPELREIIAEQYGHPDLEAEHVITTVGAAGALFLTSITQLDRNDEVLVMAPNYMTNLFTPRIIGARSKEIPMTFDAGFRLDVDGLVAMISDQTKMISLTSPHNPSGILIPEEDLMRIIRVAEEKDILILLDETYRDLTFQEIQPLGAALSEQVVSVSSLSKAYGVPGIRMGWAVTRNQGVMDQLLSAKEQVFITHSMLDEHVALNVLLKKDQLIAKAATRIKENLPLVESFFASNEVFEWVKPEGGVVCFPRFKDPKRYNTDTFYNVLFEKYESYVGPGHWFEVPDHYFRLGFGYPTRQELEGGLERLTLAADDAVK